MPVGFSEGGVTKELSFFHCLLAVKILFTRFQPQTAGSYGESRVLFTVLGHEGGPADVLRGPVKLS